MVVRPKTVRARNLRRSATETEKILWRALREVNLSVKIRRQHPIGRYVVDFAIPSRKLVIEIDGGQHATATMVDTQRTQALNELGYRVIRFWNNDVHENLEGVLQTIVLEIDSTPTSP
jgi:crossover junction endodeoxyribonuclease RuvC